MDFFSSLQNIQQQASNIGVNIDWDPTHSSVVKALVPGQTVPIAGAPLPSQDDEEDDKGMSPMTMGLIALGAFLAFKMFSRRR